MALKFYLNEINDAHQIYVQTNASFTSKVGDFDVGTLELEWNKTKNKIVPYTKLFIVDTSQNDTWCFVVLNDEVEIVRKNPPVLYLHNLTVIQNTYELTTHLVRNSVFTQNFALKKARIKAVGHSIVDVIGYESGGVTYKRYEQETDIYIAYDTTNSKYGYYYEKTYISPREKIKKVYINISTNTTACDDCTYTADRFLLGAPREYKENFYKNLYFTINKYDSSDVLQSSINVVARDGQQTLEIENTNNFFEKNYKYELIFDTQNLSQIDSYSSDSDYGVVTINPPAGETWKVPTIQTIFNCELIIETCYYYLADVLNILKEQTKKTYNGASTYADFYNVSLDEDIIAPDLTFTSQDLWSCVSDALKYIDAIPLIDENGNLVPEYLNDYGRTPIDIKKVDEKSNLSNEYYTNSLVSNYQNGRHENGVYYPAKNVFKRVASKVYGVPGPDDYQMTVSNPIDYIDKVLILLVNEEDWDFEVEYFTLANLYLNLSKVDFKGKLPNSILDISDAIYEHSVYSLLPMGDENSSTPNQLNTLYYEKGGNFIYLGGIRDDENHIKYEVYKKACALVMKGLFGLDEPQIGLQTYVNGNIYPYIYNLKYSILYHAIYNGRTSQESTINRHPGETYAAQEQGNVDLNRMGNNMQGLIARLGNEAENINIPVTDYGSRIKKGSLWVDDDGKKYIANSVKTTFSTRSSKVMVEAEFSRNFNLISQYTKINQEKRFYEIKESLVNKGYENIVEYLYFSLNEIENDSPAYNGEAIDILIKDNFIKPSFAKKADFSVVDTYQYENDESTSTQYIYIPLHAYGIGNSICFEMGFESPINAGDSLQGSGTLLNKTTLYTADDGFADKINLKVYTRNVNASRQAYDLFPNFSSFIARAMLYQEVSDIIDISQYYYYKKPNEILHVNYSIAFMPAPNQDIFFGDVLINKNSIIQGAIDDNPTKTFYLYAGDEWYSIIDNKVLSTHTRIGPVTVNYNRASNDLKGSISFTCVPTITSAKAWAIADANGNIYFAVNQELENTNTVTLYFAARRFRIN